MVDHNLVEEINQFHARICQGIADPTRILILYALDDGPRYVSELAELLGIRQPAVSHHLKVLRERGLVRPSRDGNVVRYELRDHRVIEALNLLRGMMSDILAEQADLIGALKT